jgi:hypothetical protein
LQASAAALDLNLHRHNKTAVTGRKKRAHQRFEYIIGDSKTWILNTKVCCAHSAEKSGNVHSSASM